MKRTILILTSFILITGTAVLGLWLLGPESLKYPGEKTSAESTPDKSPLENSNAFSPEIPKNKNSENFTTSTANQVTLNTDILSNSTSDSLRNLLPVTAAHPSVPSAQNSISNSGNISGLETAADFGNSPELKSAPEQTAVSSSPAASPAKRRKFQKVSDLPGDDSSLADPLSALPGLDTPIQGAAAPTSSPASDFSAFSSSENFTDKLEASSSLSISEQNTSSGTVTVDSIPRAVENGLIVPIYEVDVPAEEAGVMRKLYVQDFAQIKKDEILVQLDDRQAVMAVNVAEAKKESAEIQMKNDVNVRYAIAAHAVADAEIKKADEANHKVPNTVPDVEYNRLVLSKTQANLQIEQAQQELKVAAQNYNVSMAELDAAKLDQTRFEIHSPHDGVVMEIFRKEGEWLKPGDPILHLVQMNPIRYSFRIESKTPPESVFGQPVKLFIPTIGREVQGTVTFIKPSHDIGDMYQVWVDIENTWQPFKNQSETAIQKGYWILQPGMRAEVKSIGR